MGLLTKNQKITLASSLLMCLLSQAAYAQNYSAGNGQALGTDSVAIGEGSYATATNGVATGSGAIATGENLDKAGFNTRREKVQELERQIATKRNEINAAQNEISITNGLIANINQLINQINARQATVAQLLAEKERLTNEKTAAEQDKANLDNTLSEISDKYNRIPKNGHGQSIYNDFNNILSTLDWAKLDTQNGRDQLATDLQTKVETDFVDLVGTYTNEQYRQLIDGYVSRKVTRESTAAYLSSYIQKETQNLSTIIGKQGTLFYTTPEYLEYLMKTRDDINTPTNLNNVNYDFSIYASPYEKEQYIKSNLNSLYVGILADKDGSIANKVVNLYTPEVISSEYRIGAKGLVKLPPIKNPLTIKSRLLRNSTETYHGLKYILGDDSNTQPYTQSFRKEMEDLKAIYNSIDETNKDNWWFDVDDYKNKVEKIISFYDEIAEYLDMKARLKTELSKPLADQDKVTIEHLSAQMVIKRNSIDTKAADKAYHYDSMELIYKQDVLEQEFSRVKPVIEEIYNQTKDYIRTYDTTNEIISGVRQKAEELRDAVATATSKVGSKQNEINRLIDQIANLGLTPDDETLARRKQEQEALLAQRQQELAQHQQERDAKQAELDKLNADLANSPLRNLGTNAMAEGNNAFASGANAIAYGANALATGDNAVAMGAGAQATAENATAIGAGAKASAAGATALGQGAEAKGKNSIALGSGSVATKENEFSVGNATLKRNITNVKNGLIEDTSSEAVTGQQLKSAANILGATVTTDGLLSFEYSLDDNGTTTTVNDIKSALDIIVRNNNGTTGGQSKYVAVKSQGAAASAKGEESVAIGGNTIATGANSVAIGSGSVATSDNEFSVGNVEAGLTRRITNVAEGVADNDAVNMAQFRRLDQKLQKTEKRLSGGIAGAYAAAALINASGPGETMISAASGSFNKSVAVAVGYSRVSDNGKVSLKLLGSASNNGDVGGGIGIGYKF